MVRNWRLATVIGVLMGAALTGALQEVLRQAAGDFTRDHLSIVGDYIDWRWSTAVTLVVIFFGAWIAYSAISREIVDKSGSLLHRSDRSIRITSDNVQWVFEGWREWPDGTREPEISEECAEHSIPLLHWASSYKRADSIVKAYGRAGRFRGLLCPGPLDGTDHIVMLTKSKTIDEARRRAIARLKAKINRAETALRAR